jgi:arsenate reductase-like glutaredoxin family protein
MSCQRGDEFIARRRIRVQTQVDARKESLDRRALLALARSASRIVYGRGKKVTILDMKRDSPADEELLEVLLGPTGRLRAPTLRVGSTLLVGFHEEAWSEWL